eukprot:246770-Amphidinium_carterae.1
MSSNLQIQVISDDHIDECVLIAQEMLQKCPLEAPVELNMSTKEAERSKTQRPTRKVNCQKPRIYPHPSPIPRSQK